MATSQGSRAVRIGDRLVGPGHPCFIVAEAGVNHNGDLGLAKRLVDVAVEAGAAAVKFQTFRAERLVAPTAPKAEYQLEATDSAESQLEMLKRLELSPAVHRELRDYCRKREAMFLSTPFDEESADLLDDLIVPAFKIGSGDVTNLPLLEHVARKGKPVILSTGMSSLSEVDEAVRVIRKAGCEELVVLHCVSNYPADPADANLRAMQTIAMACQAPVGWSDHTLGIEVALAAVTLGACVIEKHFTLDRTLPGPDHRASLEPLELQALVRGIRTVERALGSGIKEAAASEANTCRVARRSLALLKDVRQGAVLGPEVVTAMRPGTGIQPRFLPLVLGRRARRPLARGELLTWEDLA